MNNLREQIVGIDVPIQEIQISLYNYLRKDGLVLSQDMGEFTRIEHLMGVLFLSGLILILELAEDISLFIMTIAQVQIFAF